MANVTSLVNDVFDILSESTIKPKELVSVMYDILVAFDESGVIDDYATELDECRGINGKLDEAIDKFVKLVEEGDGDDYYPEDEE